MTVETQGGAGAVLQATPDTPTTEPIPGTAAVTLVQDPPPGQPLTLLAEGTRMLAEAQTLSEVRKVRDLAIAARAYAKAHDLGTEARKYAGTIVVEADIRQGQILKEMAERRERATPSSQNEPGSLPTLKDLGTTKADSAKAQAMADEADEVRKWMAGAKDIAPSRAARVARDAKAKRERESQPKPTAPASCDLRLGDFRRVLESVPDGSVDVVLTDPPYPAEFLPLWNDLALFAKRVLRPTGLLVAMSGQANLPEVYARLGEHMPYRWTMAYLMAGGSNVVHARKVSTMWKPVLVYGANDRRLFDVARSDKASKEHHGWGQSEVGMADLLHLVADPGAVICDPFVGGGTTAVVALAHGCQFIGAEIDAEHYETALRRVSS